ncbi:MAG: ABC transporter ATP-binding protein [Bacteroidales bacterium]|jgi:ABC-2 type transport system ATP-binding protein|nr:ABC transporter ATP-binding protein [Bacteroidales bacterium]
MEPVITLTHLTKKYRDFTAVSDISLRVNKGEIFGVVGPNGAGKSTTILMMLGLTEPTSGEACVCGVNPVTEPVKVKQIVGYLPEDVGFYDDRTGLENIVYTARLNRVPEVEARQRAFKLLDRVGLADVANKKTGQYSKGMRQRLGLADVLIKNPSLIILDEPTTGIDPTGVHEFLELIACLREEQKLTVLLSSHNLHQIEQICDRVGIFRDGQMVAEGSPSDMSLKIFGDKTHSLDDIYNTFFTVKD